MMSGRDQGRLNMTEPDTGQGIENFAIVRLARAPGFNQAVQRVTSAIVSAREQGVTKLLLDITELGLDPPSIAARQSMAREWAAAAGAVRGAMVAPREFIDPEKFGVIVGRNFGLQGNVFETEAEAMAWIRHLD